MYAYLILFFWCFLAASAIPIGSEFYFTGLVINNKAIWLPTLIATIGNVLGGSTTFLMGWFGSTYIQKQLSATNAARYQKAQELLHKWGAVALLLSWVPIIGDIIIAVGGTMRLPFIPSMIWMGVGKFLRYLILALTSLGIISLF